VIVSALAPFGFSWKTLKRVTATKTNKTVKISLHHGTDFVDICPETDLIAGLG
jgi:hypothetical protein